MYTNPAPLAKTLDSLVEGQHSLSLYIEMICARIDDVDGKVRSLLPEPNRLDRLRSEARSLKQRYPIPTKRPALFGLLVGVKDIFHVDGFITRAGSEVPPELFAGGQALCVTRLRDRLGAIVTVAVGSAANTTVKVAV